MLMCGLIMILEELALLSLKQIMQQVSLRVLYLLRTGESSIFDGMLRISPGDTIAAEYDDHTLPDPYTTVDNIAIAAFASMQGSIDPLVDDRIILDKSMYSWTDKIIITVNTSKHNLDDTAIDTIGSSSDNKVKISTRGHELDNYELVETGVDTGIFTGEVTLTGFSHDANDDGILDTLPRTLGSGPADGFIKNDRNDGISVSFKFSEDETIVKSSFIKWNIGQIEWLDSDYTVDGTVVVRVIDPDMNLNSELIDNVDVDVWSDSDAGGITVALTETDNATGIFEGTIFITSDESSHDTLKVMDGDSITVEYEDHTLPDPYTLADELDITATMGEIVVISDTILSLESDKTLYSDGDKITLVGTASPSPINTPWYIDTSDMKIIDALGNDVDNISADQQVQITTDLTNNQDVEQVFAYLVRIEDSNDASVYLSWIFRFHGCRSII